MPWLVHVLFVIVMRIARVCFSASCCALWCVLCDVKVTTFSVMQTCIIICNACASCALLAAVCAVRHGRTRICALFPPFPLYCPLCAGWWQVRSRCPLAPCMALASNAAAPLRWPCPGFLFFGTAWRQRVPGVTCIAWAWQPTAMRRPCDEKRLWKSTDQKYLCRPLLRS